MLSLGRLQAAGRKLDLGSILRHIIPMSSKSKNSFVSPKTEAPLPTKPASNSLPQEQGGQKGPEPTRYGDWEKDGRCTDF